MHPQIMLLMGTLVAFASAGCNSDNCLRALRRRDIGVAFCSDYLAVTLSVHQPLPSYLSACKTVSVSSGCSCLLGISTKTTVSPTKGPSSSAKTTSTTKTSTSSTATSTSSKSINTSKSSPISSTKSSGSKTSSISSTKSTTSSNISTSSTSSSSSSSSSSASKTSSSTSKTSSSSSITSPSSFCTPYFSLEGASESTFNAALTPFTLRISCNTLDVQNYTVLVTGGANVIAAAGSPVSGTTNTSTTIIVPGFPMGFVNLVVVAMETSGHAILQSFELLFGIISMPVQVVDGNGAPVSGITVFANATTFPGVSQIGNTDINGLVTFNNLLATSIGLTARTSDNSIAVNGVAASANLVTLHLVTFAPASNTTDFAISNGTTGWTGGFNQDIVVSKRDTVLTVGTGGQTGIQMAHSQPKVYPFTNTVYIKYKFQTSEVPGGYFGTKFNDYFIITIRTDNGGYAAVSHSMNELGLGAFDAGGSTDWYTLQLPTALSTKWVNFDIGVSNVADALLDSQVIVDKIGDLTCEKCGDCSTCQGDPMCQATCINPPLKSCDFYASCAEATLQCGAGGYPIRYGQTNCLKFQNNLQLFSPNGQNFIWSTMHCLQLALVNAIQCDSTCTSVYDAAFASHPACYIQGGFCSLSAMDIAAVVWTVGRDLLQGMGQMLDTGIGCGKQLMTKIDQEIQNMLDAAVSDLLNAAIYLAQAAMLKAMKALFQEIVPGGFQV